MNIEGRRINTKSTAEPFGGNEEEVDRISATIGSRKLLDAILLAQGITPEPAAPPKRPKRLTRAVAHQPAKCPFCGSPKSPSGLMIAHIQATVASYYDLHVSTMTSRRQGADIAHPRQVAMYLSKQLTPKSLPDIGRRFGGRDHTTVIHAIKAVQCRIATDPEIATDVEALRESLMA